MADSKTPQGIVAEILLEQPELPDQLQGRFLYLEDVQDPGNVGTMIRTADAAGFDGVMLSKASADLYSLKTLRSMQGSHFHIPIWKLDREELLERAAHSHLAVLATTLSEASIDYRQLLRPISLSWLWGMKEMASARKWRHKQTSWFIFPCQVGQRV